MVKTYNRYQGNTGKMRRVDDRPAAPKGNGFAPPRRPDQGAHNSALPKGGAGPPKGAGGPAKGGEPFRRQPPPPPPRPVPGPPPRERRPPSPLKGLSGELGRLLGKLSPMDLETEDFLLILVLYLLYKDSGDEELLWMMAGMFLL